MDTISQAHRSWNMSRIRGKDTSPELTVRKLLHREGFRFRLHPQKLPGKPDIVLTGYRTVIFVHGCFWHRHLGCRYAYIPKTNVDFWQKKFTENKLRDGKNRDALRKLGWKVIIVWECEVENASELFRKVISVLRHLRKIRH